MQLFIQQASDFYSVIRARVKKFRTQTPCVRGYAGLCARARARLCVAGTCMVKIFTRIEGMMEA